MEIRRIPYEHIWERLSSYNQMVFIAGPRQAGKTTLTQILAKDFNNSLYFNWDIIDEKRKLIENPSFYEEVHRKDSSMLKNEGRTKLTIRYDCSLVIFYLVFRP